MAESRYSSSDVPDFSSYPASPTDHLLEGPPEWVQQAERLGYNIGRAVRAARDGGGQAVRAAREGGGRMRERVMQMRGMARHRLGDVRDRSVQVAQEKFDQAMESSHTQLQKARELARENPIPVILGAGALGLIFGATARVWRERRG
jgi:hypothetical protein